MICFVGVKNGVKYLKIDKRNTNIEDSILPIWNKVFSGIKYHIKKIDHECKLEECKGIPDCEEFSKVKVDYDEDFNNIGFVSNDNLPKGKLIYFPTITVTIRCVLKQGDLFYPQVYSDMHFINYKMETNNLLIKNYLEYIDGELTNILDLRLDDLRIDKHGKILLYITLII